MFSMLGDALVACERLSAFLSLSEKDPGIIVRNISEDNCAIKSTGNPSFTWALGKELDVPKILDTFFKEN